MALTKGKRNRIGLPTHMMGMTLKGSCCASETRTRIAGVMSFENSDNWSKVNKHCKSRIPWKPVWGSPETIRARKANKPFDSVDAFNSGLYDARSRLGATVGI